MAIQRVPVYKRCAYLGIEPSLLGYTGKAGKIARKKASRPSAYALQLKEKQKVKFIYGVMEHQFRRNFERAMQQSGSTGENLLVLMERRLDNVVFRLGLAKTRAEARQLVSHRHVAVNGRRVNIPSLAVKAGDVITMHRPGVNQGESGPGTAGTTYAANRALPGWLARKEGSAQAEVLRNPLRSDVEFDVKESMIVELYSK